MKSKDLIRKFTKPLGENLIKQIDRVGNRKASLILIDGGVGSGKTHSGVIVGDYINNHITGKPLNLKRQYAIGGEDFEVKLRKCIDSDDKIIIYDEAGDFNRRGSITKFNQRLNRIFETYRTFQIIVILILPTFAILDSQIFINRIPRMLINCHNKKQGKYTRFRAFSLNRMFWLKHYFEKLTVKPQAYLIEKANFYGVIWPLDPERAAVVDKLSHSGKEDIFNVKKDEFDKHLLAQEFGLSKISIGPILKTAGIEPIRKIKNRYVYGKNAYDFFNNRGKFKKEELKF